LISGPVWPLPQDCLALETDVDYITDTVFNRRDKLRRLLFSFQHLP